MERRIFGSGQIHSPWRCRSRAITALRRLALIGALISTLVALLPASVHAQLTATLSGRVVDESGAVVPDVRVVIIDLATGRERKTETSDRGEFVLHGLAPARYQLTAQRDGFAPLQVPDIELRANDATVLHLKLEISPIGEVLIVEVNRVSINPSPEVSTVVDRPLVTSLPLSARSLQSLIWLVPGMVRTSGSGYGHFSANGQRDNANYLTIDGVGANLNAGANAASTIPAAGGGIPAASRLGTTNNLIGVDAVESVRIQTSSYAAEFGRTPGAQIAVTSRAGTNQFHGIASIFERHDALDATDWFANAANLAKPALRHHQFGGVLGGPVIRNRAFFFGAYEGLRLRQPMTMVTNVPSMRLRDIAAPEVQRLLRAFPVGETNRGTPLQDQYTAAVSIPASLDATSVRVDAFVRPSLTMFGRVNVSPSSITTTESWNAALVKPYDDRTRTVTAGVNSELSARLYHELRVNYSSNARTWAGEIGTRGGASPLTRSDLLPTPGVFWGLFLDGSTNLWVSDEWGAVQRQFNLVDSVTAMAGAHQLKFGVDLRHLTLRIDGDGYAQVMTFATEAEIVSGVGAAFITQNIPRTPVLRSYSAYAQDTWRLAPSLTLTYGIRWDANPAPFDRDGGRPFVLRGESPILAADQPGTRVMPLPENEPLYATRWGNLAPRLGVSYRLAERRPGWDTVLRGGAGLFYDLGNSSPLWAFDANPPFAMSVTRPGVRYPLSAADAAPPPSGIPATIVAVDPHLRLPYTWQWNAAVAQSLGEAQTLTVTYVGAAGRRLLQRRHFETLAVIPSPTSGSLITSDSTSAYRALQLQFQRRLAGGLQALASYSWAHAQDAQSDDLNVIDDQARWGNADFDVRHSVAAALSYDLPVPRRPALSRLLGQWGVDTTIRASSAYPFTPRGPTIRLSDGTLVSTLPDLVPGPPIWLVDPDAAAGRRLNPAAFTLPAQGQQGNVGRNHLRGFPFSQVDLALRRAFRLRDRLRLSFRAEAFNVLNHPNFMNPTPDDRLGSPNFGRATRMANRGFGGVQGPALQQFYESGGPRSMQLSLRLEF